MRRFHHGQDCGRLFPGLAVAVAIVLFATLVIANQSADNASRNESPASADSKRDVADKRPPWTTSKITGSLDPPDPYRVERVFPSIQFKQPVVMDAVPGTDRMLVVELEGRVYTFSRTAASNAAADFAPDLAVDLKKEVEDLRQVYGFTFHPRFKENRYVYLTYVRENGLPDGTRVSRFRMSANEPPTIDTASETVLIDWISGGHNGGCLKFGPDGFLYISTGDATSPSPPDGLSTGQDLSDLPASILRIDVDRSEDGKPCSVPADNPFVNAPGARPEIWAYGFRNPWKMSFDPADGSLWVGDVGWEMWEMVYRVVRGGNYGWSVVEGPQSVRPELTRGPTPILPPAAAHSHIESRSITGGHVYHGARLPKLKGAYIYGDYVTGKLWALPTNGDDAGEPIELADSSLAVITFGGDSEGELYVVDYAGGIYRLAENTGASRNEDFPKLLSESGLFGSLEKHTPAPGVVPYEIKAEPWADGAVAERFIAVPHDGRLEVEDRNNVQMGQVRGMWRFPNDSVLVKTLSIDMTAGDPSTRRRIETQILHRDGDVWRAYAYVWNDEQTDAALAPAEGRDQRLTIADPDASNGKRVQTWHTWHTASRTECMVCHTTRAGVIHGFNVAQLDRDVEYPHGRHNQLQTFEQIGLFDNPTPILNSMNVKTPPIDNVHEFGYSASSARTYLHVNCAHCHRRGGGGTAPFELLAGLPLEKMNILGARPTQGTFDVHGAQIVAPGDPYRSLIYYRTATLGKGRMPHFGSNVVDERGLQVLHDWIARMHNTADGVKTPEGTADRRTSENRMLGSVQMGERIPENVAAMLESTSGALLLMHAIDVGTVNADVRDATLKAVVETPFHIRGLFERFLPEEQRIKRLGSIVRPEQILSQKGDASRGEAVFFNLAGAACKNCHKIGDRGKELGPPLDGIGARLKPREILDSILEPSKKVDPKFVTYLVETKRGLVHSGLLHERTAKEVVLKSAEGKLVQIAESDVETLVPQKKSLMPELLLRDMTAAQAADLLAYLTTLKMHDGTQEGP